MTSSYGNNFAGFVQDISGLEEFDKTGNVFQKNGARGNQFCRPSTTNVLDPISVFALGSVEESRYKNVQSDNYHQLNCNEPPRTTMAPSKSMPHFPNFGFNEARFDAPAETFIWSSVPFPTASSPKTKFPESSLKFEHTLMAQTSSAVKINQESLTYLNQGQCYEVKLKSLKGSDQHQYFKSIVRVIFHERRLQYSEKELMEIWKNNRPGERIIDIDIPECCGLEKLEVDPDSLNSIGFIWNSTNPTGIFVKIHCISTEFTANKHGGEKGVPLRIKVETYSVPNNKDINNQKLLHCASCQIKVFKPKGADRKHKRDCEKLVKLNQIERNQYRTPESCTLLKEMPLDHDNPQLLLGNATNVNKPLSQTTGSTTIPILPTPATTNNLVNPTTNAPANALNVSLNNQNGVDAMCNKTAADNHVNENIGQESSFYGEEDGHCDTDCLDAEDAFYSDHRNSTTQRETMSEETAKLLLSCIPVVNEDIMHPMPSNNIKNFNSEQLGKWLTCKNFSSQCKNFEAFTGVELLRLSEEDLIKICEPAEGIRLYYLLHFGSVKPKRSLYINCQGFSNIHTKYERQSSNLQYHPENYYHVPAIKSYIMSSSLSYSNLTPSLNEEERMEDDVDETATPYLPQSLSHFNRLPMIRSMSLSSVRASPYHNPRSSNFITPNDHRRRVQNNGRNLVLTDEHQVAYRNSNLPGMHHGQMFEELSRNVFYLVDLDSLSVKHLRDKLSVLYNIPVHQVQQIYFEHFGIQIMASDEHLENIQNHSRFSSWMIKYQDAPNECDILLKMVPGKPGYFQNSVCKTDQQHMSPLQDNKCNLNYF